MSAVSFLQQEADYSVLERECVIFDSSSLVKYYGFTNLMKTYYPILKKTKRSFLIPKSSVRELTESMEANLNNSSYCQSVRTALENIRFLVENNHFKYIGSGEDSCAEVILKYLFLNRKNREITVVTQDGRLADDIAGLNRIRSVPAQAMLVRRLTPEGALDEFRNNAPTTVQTAPTSFAATKSSGTGSRISENDLLDAAIEALRKTLGEK